MTRFIGAVAAFGLALTVVPSVTAQTLGDLARQEEARRKSIAAPAKVYTNGNLGGAASSATRPATGAPSQPAAAPSASGSEPGKATTAPASQPAADEATWRKRIADARDSLARSQTFADALQSRINALTTDFAGRADPVQRAAIGADRQKAMAELDRVKHEIQQYQKAITDTQEEARKANVPAGWVR
jgi:hypothetical protein